MASLRVAVLASAGLNRALLPSGTPVRISNWRHKVWQPAAGELGFPSWATPYVLRHTAASLMAQRGVPVSAAAAALGHDPAIFLRTYAHLYPGDLRAVADAMDGARRDARDAARVVDGDHSDSDSLTRGDFAGTNRGASESSGDQSL